jgi:hypothetical protein
MGNGAGGRYQDESGNDLILGDSHTAANIFGFGGSAGLLNVPKSRFMFFAKFNRASGTGGSDWERGMTFALKTVDRPRVSFEQQVLHQYNNRKRIVQTGSEFEPVMFRFHDTVSELVNRMFDEYYRYYFGDPDAFGKGNPFNNVITSEVDPVGQFGFTPPSGDGYFFNNVTVYQVFNNSVSQFQLINPKIQQFNPDELDYTSNVPNEIVMTLAYEGIVYQPTEPLSPELIELLGLDRAKYYNVEERGYIQTEATLAEDYQFDNSGVDAIDNILRRQVSRALAGERISVNSIALDAVNSFDRNRGIATARLGANALGDLVKGRTSGSVDAVRRLAVYGKPGRLF